MDATRDRQPRPDEARHELEEALHEHELAQSRYEAAIGTSAEMGAYLRLRGATRRVSAADRAVRKSGSGLLPV